MNPSIIVMSAPDAEMEARIKEHYASQLAVREWLVRIDQSIIGGYVIIDNDNVIDCSVT